MAVRIAHSSERTLLEEMELTEKEIARRKAFLEFTPEDAEALKDLNEIAERYAEPVIEDLYRHFLAHEETKAFFQNPATLERVKRMQKEYFLRLTSGDYGTDYIANRVNIGRVHERINLVVKWYLGAYNFYLRAVAKRLVAGPGDPKKALPSFLSLMKLVFLDVGLALDTYIFQRERTIREQQEAIRELSTPVLQIRDRLLILPIIGIIDSYRARQITEGLLRAIRANRAKVAVVDITGVPAVDSKVANHLVQTVAAVRLMGATLIVTGLSAEVAQTLVTLGVDLRTLNTVGDLQGGLEEAERLLGYEVVRRKEPGAERRPG